VFGECGGYMVLGQGLVDADGNRHAMTGHLPVETSFANRKLHLGYRTVTTMTSSALGPKGTVYRAHEFHYASTVSEDNTTPLFTATNARGDEIGTAGTAIKTVGGSFIHLIDRIAA
ncbi:MAG: cobyrinic acid a,c-diamide synthase, partial [Alphaproteobacteria bacterium]|nr:cobyrinic acid a,c-diamide synthase [Alphaproteobacteria bacterium]